MEISSESEDFAMAENEVLEAPNWRLEKVRISNFKSYSGDHEIGPLEPTFCAVVGQNGSGKSNLMDAVSFAVGVESRKLRGENMKKLISEGAQGSAAEVELILQQGTRQMSFCRKVNISGDAQYRIDQIRVSFEEYKTGLDSVGLGAGNFFLVFQGDAENLAAQSPEGLSAMLDKVSGSAELKIQYESACKEKQEIEETLKELTGRRKHQLLEKRVVASEMEEFTKFQNFLKKRENLKTQNVLFKLWCVRDKSGRAKKNKQTAEAQMGGLADDLEGMLAAMESAKKRRAEAEIKKAKAERICEKLRNSFEKAESEVVETKTKKRHAELKLTKISEKIKNAEKIASDTCEKEINIAHQIDALTRHLSAQEHELNKTSFERNLSNEQRMALARFRVDMEISTCDLAGRIRSLERELRSLSTEQDNHEKIHSDLRLQLESVKSSLTQTKIEKQRAVEEAEEAQRLASKMKNDLSLFAEEIASARRKEETLKSEKREIVEMANFAKDSEKDLQKEDELRSLVSEIVTQFGSHEVFGRMRDLIRPLQSRYHSAIQTALGKFGDSLVVTTPEIGRKVIAWLKERRRGTLSIVPIEGLRGVGDSDDEGDDNSNIPSGCRLALNCVKFDISLKPVAVFAMGNFTLIADDLTVARRAAFEGNHKKVVTILGEKISRSGTISADVSRKNQRWDAGVVAEARARLEIIEKELSKIQSFLATADTPEERVSAVKRAEALARSYQETVDRINTDVSRKKNQLNYLTGEIENEKDKLSGLADLFDSLSGNLAKFTDERGIRIQNDCKIFAVNNGLSECDWKLVAEGDKMTEEKTRKITKIKDQIKVFENELSAVKINKENSIDNLRKEHSEVLSNFAKFTDQLEIAEKVLAKLIDERLNSKAAVEEGRMSREQAEREISEISENITKSKQHAAELTAAVKQADAEIVNMISHRSDLIRKSFLDRISLPFKDAISEERIRAALIQNNIQSDSLAIWQSPDDSESDDAIIDFESLPVEFRKNDIKPSFFLEIDNKFKMQLSELEKEIDRISPNLRAQEKANALAAESSSLNTELEAARKTYQQAITNFEQKKKDRLMKYNECFDFTKRKVDEFYKILTRRTTNINGYQSVSFGSAFLDADIPDEPFNGGIRFSLLPPGKRVTEVGLLSGGERTIAATALLFALIAYRKPPFVMVDEMDAALDQKNVKALGIFLRETKQQVLVISLKESLYSKADGLVGVYKDRQSNTSHVVCLDLRAYPDDDNEDYPRTAQVSGA